MESNNLQFTERDNNGTQSPGTQADTSPDIHRSSKYKLHILRLRSEANRKLQKQPPNFAMVSDGPREEWDQLDPGTDAMGPMSDVDFSIKSALSLPIVPQGQSDATGRLLFFPGIEPSIHSESSTGSRGQAVTKFSINQASCFKDPVLAMESILKTLARANASQRVDLNWEAQNQALQESRRLIEHHSSLVLIRVTTLVAAILPAVDALRSQTAHMALIALQEVVEKLGTGADTAAEAIVAAASRRGGEISRAGRESSLSADADTLLSTAVRRLSASKVAVALLAHLDDRNQYTRSRIAGHLYTCIAGNPSHFSKPGAGALQGSIFKAALACLEEGSPSTRACGRKLLLELHLNIIEPGTFQGLLEKLHSQSQYIKVKELLNTPRGDL